MKIQVSMPAVLIRVNRKLKVKGLALRKTRQGAKFSDSLGEFYVIDACNGTIDSTNVDLETYARLLGVLHPYEQLEAA